MKNVLALNCGSSSLKFGVYACDAANCRLLLEGEAEEVGSKEGTFWVKDGASTKLSDEKLRLENLGEAAKRAFDVVAQRKLYIDIVGHRVVHGGPHVLEHTLLTPQIFKQLIQAEDFAPLHVPPALEVMKAAQASFGDVPQVACLDTAFHRDLPLVSRRFPLPKEYFDEGVRRYGAHGLSLESILEQLGDGIPQRLAIAHLGNGASITAVHNGKSIDTTMGLTPTGGVMMGTRTGDVDPGVLLYLRRKEALAADALEQLVDRKSGLLGVSGVTRDMRELRQLSRTNDDARLAVDMFCYQVAKAIAAMAVALYGIDMIVFTGGIGEHDAATRAEVCSRLHFANVLLDEQKNAAASTEVQSDGSACVIRVMPSQEDLRIAQITAQIVK
jgi:acetate kinase